MCASTARAEQGTAGTEARATVVPMALVEDRNGNTVSVTAGIVDAAAVYAFTSGQCHALAYAISERTGWPLAWRGSPSCHGATDDCDDAVRPCICQLEHLLVVAPDGCWIGIGGAHDPTTLVDELPNGDRGGIVDDRLRAGIDRWWPTPEVDLATTFVEEVLAQHRQTPTPTSGSH